VPDNSLRKASVYGGLSFVSLCIVLLFCGGFGVKFLETILQIPANLTRYEQNQFAD